MKDKPYGHLVLYTHNFIDGIDIFEDMIKVNNSITIILALCRPTHK